jgi:hypothetical protein
VKAWSFCFNAQKKRSPLGIALEFGKEHPNFKSKPEL